VIYFYYQQCAAGNMMYDKYELTAEPTLMNYSFLSEGPKGKIIKLISYTETGVKDVYNLGFGDRNIYGQIDDEVITNNGDSRIVLATVASTVYAFTDKYPNAAIYAKGSCKIRTRLYRIGIANNLKDIMQSFDVYGLIGDVWFKFEKNVDYEAFLIKRKKLVNLLL
jgi:hypothetical protein